MFVYCLCFYVEREQGAMAKSMAKKDNRSVLNFLKNLMLCVKKCRDVMCLCYICIQTQTGKISMHTHTHQPYAFSRLKSDTACS
jgi:hypothetical protein